MTDRADAHAATVLADGLDTETAADVLSPVVAGRYEVLGLLGAGAMGTVYRARDRELDEVVALKVLKKELAAVPGMLDRFRREVKLSRRVTHRNVARVFDIGEADGDRFLTMEFVEGESLARRLARVGRLSLREVGTLTLQICAGLQAAHEAGVLHRDLKPDNVIVTPDGRAVITDFGIARAVAEGEAKTAVGSFVGTPLYMAPEQVEGMHELDARADLYALGAMGYELLTGEPAWQRPSVVAVAAARLLSPAPDPRERVPEIPAPVAELSMKLMARRREDRPASAADVMITIRGFLEQPIPELPAPPRPTALRKRKKVALLALDSAADERWLAYALEEELTGNLARIEEIELRSSAERRREGGRAASAREQGRVLDVDAVVTGVLRRVDDRARVTLRILMVEDGFQLWAKAFDVPMTDVGHIADEASRAIATALTTRAVIPPRPTVEPEIEELYLRGRYFLYRGLGAARDQAVALFREAHRRAPADARIAGGLALALARAYRAQKGQDGNDDEARRVARLALDLDATRPEGRLALGTIHLADGDGEKAAIEVASALRVSLGNVDALDTMGRILVEAGAAKEGLRLLDLALAKEDISIARHARVRTNVLLGDWDRVEEAMSEIAPDAVGTPAMALLRVRLIAWCPDPELSREIARGAPHDGPPPEMLAVMKEVEREPRSTDARQAVRLVLEKAAATMPHHTARGRALVEQLRAEGAFFAGDDEAGLAALRIADEANLFDLLWLDGCALFDRMRSAPAFVRIRDRVAARANAIVAAYERSRFNSRARG